MAYDIQLKTDPNPMPLKPAVLVLIHKRRRQVFVSYTTNARGRTAVLASMIRHRPGSKLQRSATANGKPAVGSARATGGGRKPKVMRNHLRDLPEGTVADFAVMAMNVGLEPKKADAQVEKVGRMFERKGFTIFGGARSAIPKVVLDGKRMTIVEAMEVAKAKDSYQTVYRRIQRGWPVKEALGLVERAA